VANGTVSRARFLVFERQIASLTPGFRFPAPLLLAIAWMLFTSAGSRAPAAPEMLLRPMLALVVVTFVVWFLTLVVRNAAVMRGKVPVAYFKDNQPDDSVEKLERPARNFNNLMQIPTLFYVVCLLMLVMKQTDKRRSCWRGPSSACARCTPRCTFSSTRSRTGFRFGSRASSL
jgi:hypothetical protein